MFTKETEQNILSELKQLYLQMQKNEILFNMTDDDDLIEAAIYEKQALNARYTYLIKTAKEQGLKINFTERI